MYSKAKTENLILLEKIRESKPKLLEAGIPATKSVSPQLVLAFYCLEGTADRQVTSEHLRRHIPLDQPEATASLKVTQPFQSRAMDDGLKHWSLITISDTSIAFVILNKRHIDVRD